VVKCSELLQSSEVRLVLFLIVVFMVCILLLNSVSYVFLLLCLCILIFCILCSVYSAFIVLTIPTEVFACFFRSCKANARVYLAMAGHGQHSSKLVNFVGLCIVLCKCVLYYSHQVSIQMQLTNIS